MAKVYQFGNSWEVDVPAGESIAVYTEGKCKVYRKFGYPNQPEATALIGTVSGGQTVFGSYASGATIVIDGGPDPVLYEVGATPQVKQDRLLNPYQADPVAVNVTGAVSATAIMGGIVTSTTAAAVAGTVPTGTVMDASSEFGTNESVDWSVINTGPNGFTVTAATGHTLVGAAVVATATSGLFRTRKTAANTFVTYRIG